MIARALMLAATLAGLGACSQRPADVPAPAPGWFAGFGDACPDLRGSYRLQLQPGKHRTLPGTILRDLVQAPAHHSLWSIESLDAERLVLRTWATTEDMRRGMDAWRKDNAYGYALWSQSLVASKSPGGLRLERRSDATLRAPENELPRSLEFVLHGSHYHCEGGWLVLNGEPEPDADDAERAEVRLARARDGGVVASWRFRRAQSFSIWCGDGCKPGIPLPDEHVQRWWHAPPAPRVELVPIDWKALIATDGRPADVRERYREGTFLAYHVDAAGSGSAPPAASALLADVPAGATASVSASASVPDRPERQPAVERRWRERIAPLLPTGTDLADVRCETGACVASGHARSMTDVSVLLRALEQLDGPTPDLLLIERIDAQRHRFEIRLAAD